MTRRLGMLFPLLGLAVFAFSQSPGASATANDPANFNMSDVAITPKRLIFEGRTRAAEVNLANQSDKTITYDISFLHLRMNGDGSLQEVSDAGGGEVFADALLRYSPRRVVLAPRQTQSVRFQLRRPEGLADGEYRTHVVIRVVPTVADSAAKAGAAEDTAVSVKLVPVYGVAIPVFVRQGQLAASARLSNIAVSDPAGGAPTMSFQIDREGGRSVYGNLQVELIRGIRAPLVVGKLNGVAVYPPLASRPLSMPLELPKGLQIHGATFRLRFVGAEDEDNPVTLATAQVITP